jgi:7-cyano-7-deazaguanine reductase
LTSPATEEPVATRPTKKLETFPNPRPGRSYEIRFSCPEFTCLCPLTGQPDFAVVRIRYVPRDLCVELKSLKLYLWSFRDEGHFHEAVTNRILDDLVEAVEPRWIEIEGDFAVRGGIRTVVRVEHGERPGSAPAQVAAAEA